MAESKPSRWEWLKEEFAKAVVGAILLGILMVAGFGLVEAYLSDYRRERLRDEINKTLVDNHNDEIKREGELLERTAKLEKVVAQQAALIAQLSQRPALPDFPTIPQPERSHTENEKIAKEVEDWRKLPRLDPSQQRLDWQDKNVKKYNDMIQQAPRN